MPLTNSFWLSKKKGKEVWLAPVAQNGQVRFEIRCGKGAVPEGTVARAGAKCIACGESVPMAHVREEAQAGRMHSQLMAIVAESKSGRIYLEANDEHIKAAQVDRPEDYPDGEMPQNPCWFSPPMYGLTTYADLFTNRQLTALTTFSDLIPEVQAELRAHGGSQDYSDAVAVYLAFVVDKLADRNSSICSWDISRDGLRNTFGRQALPMTWDYAEGNPFSKSSGCFDNMLEWVEKSVQVLPAKSEGKVFQQNAAEAHDLQGVVISTDPPYYDNIGYADLSDFFYIWLRRSLKNIYPDVFSTMLVPKKEELIATPYRFDGSKQAAKEFFESGMAVVCRQLYQWFECQKSKSTVSSIKNIL